MASRNVVKAGNVLDVTVVLLEGGMASTAIAPIEVFHSAGVLWNWLHGETQEPRFRVRLASVDGRTVNTLTSLKLIPYCGIGDVKQTDIIIVSASGWVPRRSRPARRTACHHPLGNGRDSAPALSRGAVADRAIRHGGPGNPV